MAKDPNLYSNTRVPGALAIAKKRDRLKALNAELVMTLEDSANFASYMKALFAPGYSGGCEIIANRANAALAKYQDTAS